MSDRPTASSDSPSSSHDAAPQDAAFDPAQAALDRAAERDADGKKAKKASGARKAKLLAGASLLILVAGGIGYVTLPWWASSLPPALQQKAAPLLPAAMAKTTSADSGDVDALRDALGGLQTKLSALEKRVATLEKANDAQRQEAVSLKPLAPIVPAAPAASAEGAAPTEGAAPAAPDLTSRLAALEASVTTTVTENFALLQRDIETLRANGAQASSVLALSDRLGAVEEAVQKSLSRQDQALAFLLAVGQLRAAVEEGRPFTDELKTMRAIAPVGVDTATPSAGFADSADYGVQTTVRLQQSFASLGADIIRASALPDESADWWTRTVDRLLSVISIRRTDGEAVGNGAAAIVSRAEALLDSGSLSGAVEELSALTGAPAEVAAPWLVAAKARLAATVGLSDLTGEALAALTASAVAPVDSTAPSGNKEN